MRPHWMMALLCLCALALGAAPPLNIAHAPPGYSGKFFGPQAVWQGRGQSWFGIHTLSNLSDGSGTVQRRAFTGDYQVLGAPLWDAAQLLDAMDPQQRQIFTPDRERGTTVAFAWDTLPAPLRAGLDADGLGEARTAFLRGGRLRETGQSHGVFRQRRSVLGDIVRSVPLIVGAPVVTGDTQRRAFAEQYAAREKAVYVGANDGMLHAFSAESGQELFAFIPSSLHGQLAALSAPGYQPRAYVDGSASQADVLSGGRWRTVLVAGMGMGARGLFSLDITDPARFADGEGARWEFSASDDPAIGHVHAPPVLSTLPADGTQTGWSARQVAIVSSGLEPDAAQPGPALFVIALDKPAGQAWSRDLNYRRIDTEGSSGQSPNALAPPAVVVGDDGAARHAYAGDLQGNVWYFDLLANTSRRIFTARDGEGRTQPITHAPHVVHGPGGGYLVIFGTGKLLEDADLEARSFTVQSLYAIHDVPAVPSRAVRSRAELAERVLRGEASYEISGEVLDYFVPNAKRGWYFDLPGSRSRGERAAASPVSAGGVVVFHTVMPGLAGAGGMPGRQYLVGALNGLAVDPLASAKRPARTGELVRVTPVAQLILIKGSGAREPPSPTGGVTVRRVVTVLAGVENAPGKAIDIKQEAGRVGWREISNWHDLHVAARREGGS